MYHFVKRRTNLTIKNLEIAFPEKSLAERKALTKKCFKSLADSMAFNTLMMSGRFSNEDIMDSVEVEGWEHYEKAERESDKGICVFTAHIGNWELMPQYAALKIDAPIHVIARETTNPLLEEHIVKPMRERFGVSVFYKQNAIMRMIKAFRKGEHAGILVDQKLNPPEGIMVDFFGRPAPTTPAVAFLQRRIGVTVIPAFMVKDNGKYKFLIKEPVVWTDNGKDNEEQIKELTQLHQQIVEDVIRDYPEQWFWVHNRWGLKKEEYR